MVPFIHVMLALMLNMAGHHVVSATLKKIANISHFRKGGNLLSAISHVAICYRLSSILFQNRRQSSKASRAQHVVIKSPENGDFCHSTAHSLFGHGILGSQRIIFPTDKDGDEKYLEVAPMTDQRKGRIPWLACRFASQSSQSRCTQLSLAIVVGDAHYLTCTLRTALSDRERKISLQKRMMSGRSLRTLLCEVWFGGCILSGEVVFKHRTELDKSFEGS